VSVTRKKKVSPVPVEETAAPVEETAAPVEAVKVTEQTVAVIEKKNDTQSVLDQIKRISEHLVFLEKKLDTLLEQSKNQKPFQGGFVKNQFQSPRQQHRPYERGGYHPKFGGGGHNRERFHGSGGGNYGPRPQHGSDGYYQKKFHSHQGPSSHHPSPGNH
jgi:hypothetical protein